MYHPRVRGPRRVRPHPQDHPGSQEAGVKWQEAGEGAVHERVGEGRQEGNSLFLPACLQTSAVYYWVKIYFPNPFDQMDGMVTTPLNTEEAEKTLAQIEENKHTRLNRLKRDLKVNILMSGIA